MTDLVKEFDINLLRCRWNSGLKRLLLKVTVVSLCIMYMYKFCC